jgi:hypothetical protein
MENEFVPYGIALQMKELGYNERNIYHYANGVLQEGITYNSDHRDYESISAPLYQQAFRWFREKYGYYNQIHKGYGWEGIIRNSNNGDILWNDGTYNSPEEAQLECLKKLIQIVKK